MTVVADSGPLIAFAKFNRLELLHRLYGTVLTAGAVFTEVVTAGLAMKATDADLLNSAYNEGWLQVQRHVPLTFSIPTRLHRGELESILLAIESRAEWLLMDDLIARRAAESALRNHSSPTLIKGTLISL